MVKYKVMMGNCTVSPYDLHAVSNPGVIKDQSWACHIVTLKFRMMTTWMLQCLETGINWELNKGKNMAKYRDTIMGMCVSTLEFSYKAYLMVKLLLPHSELYMVSQEQ